MPTHRRVQSHPMLVISAFNRGGLPGGLDMRAAVLAGLGLRSRVVANGQRLVYHVRTGANSPV